MDESDTPRRPRRCARCGAPVRMVVNPYYGVGLAVHRQLFSCTRCDLVEFVPRGPDEAAVDRVEPIRVGPWRRLRCRVVGLLRPSG